MKRELAIILLTIMICLVGLSPLWAGVFQPQERDAVVQTYEKEGFLAYSNAKRTLPRSIYNTFLCIDETCDETLPPCTIVEFKNAEDIQSQRYNVFVALSEDNLITVKMKFQYGVYMIGHKLKDGQCIVLRSVDSDDEIVVRLAEK